MSDFKVTTKFMKFGGDYFFSPEKFDRAPALRYGDNKKDTPSDNKFHYKKFGKDYFVSAEKFESVPTLHYKSNKIDSSSSNARRYMKFGGDYFVNSSKKTKQTPIEVNRGSLVGGN